MVVKAHAVPGKSQCGDGVKEAGSQTSKASVSKGGLQLHLLDLRQVVAVFCQHLPRLLKKSQVDEVVGQKLSNQKFRGNVI